jgi:glyoxylase I family protein
MTLTWSHVALNCADQAVTEEFYHSWFGFERARSVVLGSEEIIFLRSGEVLLELFAADQTAGAELVGAGLPGAGSAAAESAVAESAVAESAVAESAVGDGPHRRGVARHLAFQTDDVDAFMARIGDHVTVSLGPLDFDDFIPGWRSVWFTDPDGVAIEVSQGYHDKEGCQYDD